MPDFLILYRKEFKCENEFKCERMLKRREDIYF